jgi:hypothetical protein
MEPYPQGLDISAIDWQPPTPNKSGLAPCEFLRWLGRFTRRRIGHFWRQSMRLAISETLRLPGEGELDRTKHQENVAFEEGAC